MTLRGTKLSLALAEAVTANDGLGRA